MSRKDSVMRHVRFSVRHVLAALAIGASAAGHAAAQPATPAPMPIDLAFGRQQLAREDRFVVTRDGARVAYTVSQAPDKSPGDWRYLQNGVPVSAVGDRVYVTEVASATARPAARSAGAATGNCWRPSWSPDGKQLALYCDEGGKPQLWIYDVASNKSRRVSDAQIKVKLWAGDEAMWSPDGRELFVPLGPPLSPVPAAPLPKPRTDPPKAGEAPAVTVFTTETPEKKGPAGGGNDLLPHYMRENNAALGAIDAATGKVRVVAPADATPFPSVLRLSPSGKWLSYLSVFHKPGSLDTTSFHDLALIPAAGGTPRVLDADIQVTVYDYHLGEYVWHPTRDQITWWKAGKLFTLDLTKSGEAPRQLGESLGPLAMAPMLMTRDGSAVVVGIKPFDQHDYRDPYPTALAVVPLDGSAPKTIALPEKTVFQQVISSATVGAWQAWQPQPDTLTVIVREAATAQDMALRIDIATGRATTLWKGLGRLRIAGSPESHDGLIASFEDISTPANLYRFTSDLAQKTRLTDVEPRLANVVVGSAETFETIVPQYDGSLTTLATGVLLPPGAKRGDRLPALVFLYPGGKVSRSASEYGGGMPSTVPVSAFTTRGYAVLLAELPIGPDGVAGNPVQEMVDVLLPQIYHAADLGFVDPNRLAVSGQSYGGYGTVSIISATNIFRGAVAISGLYDLGALHSWMTHLGTPAMARWAETGQGRMGTHPWGDLRRYLVNSPYYRADYVHTPLLMLQGEADTTCPVEDARKMFNALKRLDREAELRTYAGEGHVVNGWSRVNAVDAVNRMLTFLDEHVRNAKPRPATAAATAASPASK
jgi:dipeptidyl aminopeptidase/acylaminoacyl peptidase